MDIGIKSSKSSNLTAHLIQTTYQVLSSHMWLVAIKWDSAVIGAQITHKMSPFRMSVVVYFDLFLSSPEPMKLALSIEAKAWKMLLCRYLNEEYKKKMSDMITFINDYLKKLSRPIRDLDDVRFAMEALSCIRDNEIQMDMTLGPIEVRNDYAVHS